MINHARTLLLNISGESGYLPDYPGEELIAPTYRPLALPTYLQTIRSRLFGATPDRSMLNYRAMQIFKLLDKTELQQHIVNLDSRITYGTRPPLSDASFKPTVTKQQGETTDRLYITGAAIEPDSTGICNYNYSITLDTSHFILSRLNFPLSNSTIEYEFVDGETKPVALPFSGYKIHTNTTNQNARWTVKGNLRPTRTLSEIDTSLRSIGEPALIQLFGVTDVEPYITFKNCWQYHTDFAYRFGGLILAYIYRSDEIYNGK